MTEEIVSRSPGQRMARSSCSGLSHALATGLMLRIVRALVLIALAGSVVPLQLFGQELDPSEWLEPRPERRAEDPGLPTPYERAWQIARLAEEDEPDPEGYAAVFSDGMLERMPPEEMHAILRRYISRYGSVEQVLERVVHSRYAARLEYLFEGGVLVPIDLALRRDTPRLVDSVWISAARTVEEAIDAVVEELSALPGEMSLLAQHLGYEGEPNSDSGARASINAGRTVKAGELAARTQLADILEATEDEAFGWDTVVRLNETRLQELRGPAGVPVTVYTAAALAFADPQHAGQRLLADKLADARITLAHRIGPVRDDPVGTSLEELARRYQRIVQAEGANGEMARSILAARASRFPEGAETGRHEQVTLARTDDEDTSEGHRAERGYLLRGSDGRWYFVAAVWVEPLERPRVAMLDRRLQRILELVSLL